MTTYRTRDEISYVQPVVIQMGTTATNPLDNTEPADTLLVYEHGIWKYPSLAAAGAVVIPVGTDTRPSQSVVLEGIQIAADASGLIQIWLGGSPTNTSEEPYPSGSAALYDERDVLLDSATAQYYTARYGTTGPMTVVLPGQRVWVATAVATGAQVRFFFRPNIPPRR